MSIQRAARLVIAAELLLILAIAPALMFPSPNRLLVLIVPLIIWLCAWISGAPVVARTPLNAAVLLLLAMVGVSLIATFDARFSLGKVSGVVLGVLLFWAIARWLITAGRLRIAIATFVLSGAGLAVVGLLGTQGTDKFPALSVVSGRLPLVIQGVVGAEDGFNPNAVAGCLVLFVPLQMALLAAGGHRWLLPPAAPRWAIACLIGANVTLLMLTAGTLLLMQSRGAWAGLFAAMLGFLLWHSSRTRALAAVAGSLLVVTALTAGPGRLLSLAVNPPETNVEATLLGRLELWSSALYGIGDFPFTGMGMNAFRRLMPLLYPTPLAAANGDPVHAHNHLLQAAVDLGLPGLIAYLSIWLTAGLLLVLVFRQGQRTDRALAGGLGAGLIAHFVFGITDVIPLGSKAGVLFWLALALTAALHRLAVGDPRRGR